MRRVIDPEALARRPTTHLDPRLRKEDFYATSSSNQAPAPFTAATRVAVVAKKSKAVDIRSLTDLFGLLSRLPPGEGNISLYRGHPDTAYMLRPSIFRKKEYRRVERSILRELIAIQPNEFREDKSAFEQLTRMQHYGLPTRLLDLTYNPLVGLYFACSNDETKDGALLTFTMRKSTLRYFDSDTVSCVANLSNMTGRERDAIRKVGSSTALNSNRIGKRLLHFVMAEKPYFEPRIRLSDLKSVLAVRPKQSNRRILAQQGAFLIFGLASTLKDSNAFGITVSRATVPASAKKKLLSELDSININAGSLFPEIESAAKYLLSKIPPIEETDEKPD